jgi:hypothetical protein
VRYCTLSCEAKSAKLLKSLSVLSSSINTWRREPTPSPVADDTGEHLIFLDDGRAAFELGIPAFLNKQFRRFLSKEDF